MITIANGDAPQQGGVSDRGAADPGLDPSRQPAEAAGPAVSLSLGTQVLLAIWIGLASGLLEAAYRFLRRGIGADRDVAWMVPISDAVVISAAAVALHFAARLVRRRVSTHTAILVPIALGALGGLLAIDKLHPAASVVLAAGVGAQAARLMLRHWPSVVKSCRKTAVLLAAATALVSAGVRGWEWSGEHHSVERLAVAPKGAPNILLVVLDTFRASEMSLFGYGRPTTPELDRLAARGTSFERAYSAAPWTLPSHASMFTGRWARELSADFNRPLDGAFPTIAEALRSRGYATGGFVANSEYCCSGTGLARGFDHYEDQSLSLARILTASSLGDLATTRHVRSILGWEEVAARRHPPDVSGGFLDWASSLGGHPFFAFLNYFDTHSPYLPPPRLAEAFRTSALRHDPLLMLDLEHRWTPEEVTAARDAHDACVAYASEQVGAMLDELDRRGLASNTIVIVTGDHGEEFLEHGVMEHSTSLYAQSLHVPLILVYPPRIPVGLRVGAPVSMRELAPTILELGGVPVGATFGRSLLRHLDPATSRADDPVFSDLPWHGDTPHWFPIAKGNMRSLVLGDRHLIHNGDGTGELYDVRTDPEERQNRIDDPKEASSLAEMRRLLDH